MLEVPGLTLAQHGPSEPLPGLFRYDAKKAQRAIDFFERILVHTKGRHAGAPFLLDDWQKHDIVGPIFGTMSLDEQYDEWVRQYRIAWIELGRKNGKSELASGFALLGLCADDEESAEVFSVAADKDQASLVFNTAKRMVELSPILSKRLIIVDSRKRIVDPKTNSVYQVLPGDAAGALGTNPSMVLFDEVLTQKDRHLWDAMRQGFGTRRQPILIATTTAAYTSATFALEEHEYGERVEKDPALDPQRFVYMRNCPKDWDWKDEGAPATETTPATGWFWANPALGSFLNITNLRAEAREAAEKPSAQNAFRVFRLNQWTAQAERWLDMHLWDENALIAVDREKLKGRPCFAGLDLASTSDFTSWVLVFPGSPEDPTDDGYTVLPHFFLPRPAVTKRQAMQESLSRWERDGYITVNEGPVTDYEAILGHISRDAEDFNIQLFAYDPWNATHLVNTLESQGLVGVKVPQSASRLNDPCKLVESLLADRALHHGGHPVLRWNADNVELDVTADGLMKPSKKKSGEKIDGIAALVNALFLTAVPVEEVHAVTFIRFDAPEPDAQSPEALLYNPQAMRASDFLMDDE